MSVFRIWTCFVVCCLLFRVKSESRKSVTSLRQIRRQAITKPYVVQKSSGEFHIVNTVMSRVSECNIFSKLDFKPMKGRVENLRIYSLYF